MALKETITTARKFADDTILLASYITNADLFYHDGYQHNRAMKLAASYSHTDTQGLINSIFDAVDDNHNLQLVFDLWKNQLNTIALPNYDDAHFYREFGSLQYFDEATDIREMLLSVCGDLKNQITYFMEDNRITDNSPKLGFLCPLFYEDDNVITDAETNQQEAIKQPVASKPQQKVKRGRKVIPFADCLLAPDKLQHLKKLHSLIDGRKGKDVALVIKASMQLGWLLSKPTFTQLQNEFGDIGNVSGYNHQMNIQPDKTEIECIKTALQASTE